jgi:ACS family tartrate transporter-like MFS transporter
VPALLAAAAFVLGSNLPAGGLALACLVVGGFGLGSAQGSFWALPTSFLGGGSGAVGITLINILGSSGGLVTPPAIGWIRAQTGSFAAAVYAISGMLVVGALLLIVIRRASVGPSAAAAAMRTAG